MATKVIQLSELSRELGRFTEVHIDDMRKAATLGVLRSIPDLVAASPVDTGLYAASWDFTADEKMAVIGNYAPHAPIIEHGARPFTPPIGPLLAWAKRVLQDGSQPPEYSDRVWALAVGTQKKIQREGMKPRNILENALPGILANIKRELEELERS